MEGERVTGVAAVGRSQGALLIVTGSSHVGKSTLIRELLGRADVPTHYVSIDEAIEEVDLPPEDRWEHGLRKAYTRAFEATVVQLRRGALVMFESTFTYIPPDERPGQFHLDEIERLLEVAVREGADVLIVHLKASVDDLIDRRNASQRLNAEILLETFKQHMDPTLPEVSTIVVDTSQFSVEEAADLVWDEATRRFGLA